MLGGLTVLLSFQLAGEALVQLLGWPIPGPVVGMALLLLGLIAHGSVPQALKEATDGLLSHFSILFVPGGVGVMLYLPRLREESLPILASLVRATVLTLVVSAGLLRALSRRWNPTR